MGFRRSAVVVVMLAAAAPAAVALAAPQTKPASSAPAASAPASSTSAATPASSASTAAPTSASSAATAASAAKAKEAAFEKLKAVKTNPGDPKVGKTKAVACGACHGPTGNSTDPQYPKLAEQSEQYIVTQLMRFKSGVRQNAIMAGMAAALTPQDMHDIGAYFAEQKRSPGVADDKLTKVGKQLYDQGDASRGIPACMACHGPDGAGNPGWRVPDIAGQHAQYVQQQLQAWHTGTTWGSDTHSTIMPTIAHHLTEQDITAVSSYVEGLHAAPPPKPASRPDSID